MRRTAIPYRDALQWLLDNDDTEFIDNDNTGSVTLCLVADIYGRSTERAWADLARMKKAQRDRRHAA